MESTLQNSDFWIDHSSAEIKSAENSELFYGTFKAMLVAPLSLTSETMYCVAFCHQHSIGLLIFNLLSNFFSLLFLL